MKRFWLIVVLALLAGFLVVMLLSGCGRGYSEGDRTGTLCKLSSKGLVYKSWEGELLLGGTVVGGQGAVANTWQFTIIEESLVKPAQEFERAGTPVTVHYVQWLQTGLSMDTDYEAVSIAAVKPKESK